MERLRRYLTIVALSTILADYGCEKKAPEENKAPYVAPAVSLQEPAPIRPYVDANDKETHDYSIILDRNIFGPLKGSSDGQKQQKGVAGADAPRPKLRLVGTIAGDIDTGYAVIEYDSANTLNTKQHRYRVGDTLEGGAIVESIERNWVTIRYGGEIEKLKLYTRTGGNITPVKNAERPVRRKRGFGDFIRTITSTYREIDGKSFINAGGMEEVIKSVNDCSYYTNGNEEGLLIDDLGEMDALAQIGFIKGDVIQYVNGHSLYFDGRGPAEDKVKLTAAKQKMFQILKKARSSDSPLDVQILRNKRKENLKFSFN